MSVTENCKLVVMQHWKRIEISCYSTGLKSCIFPENHHISLGSTGRTVLYTFMHLSRSFAGQVQEIVQDSLPCTVSRFYIRKSSFSSSASDKLNQQSSTLAWLSYHTNNANFTTLLISISICIFQVTTNLQSSVLLG